MNLISAIRNPTSLFNRPMLRSNGSASCSLFRPSFNRFRTCLSAAWSDDIGRDHHSFPYMVMDRRIGLYIPGSTAGHVLCMDRLGLFQYRPSSQVDVTRFVYCYTFPWLTVLNGSPNYPQHVDRDVTRRVTYWVDSSGRAGVHFCVSAMRESGIALIQAHEVAYMRSAAVIAAFVADGGSSAYCSRSSYYGSMPALSNFIECDTTNYIEW